MKMRGLFAGSPIKFDNINSAVDAWELALDNANYCHARFLDEPSSTSITHLYDLTFEQHFWLDMTIVFDEIAYNIECNNFVLEKEKEIMKLLTTSSATTRPLLPSSSIRRTDNESYPSATRGQTRPNG